MRLDAVVISVLRPQLPLADRLLPYLRRIDSTRLYSNHGPLEHELEGRLSDHCGLPPGGIVCTSSGTTALVGSILAVTGRATANRPLALIPAFTFIATAAAVEQCGYRPFLADVDGESWMLDPPRLVDHPELDRIGLVIAVAPFGRPVPQAPWQRFRETTGIPVVIDGAASFVGASGDPHRFFGDIPVALSFHATKAFSTGEGGGVASTDLALTTTVVQALNFGVYEARDCGMASTNGKMSEYHAAVGLAEFDGWSGKLAAFRAVADAYRRCAAAAGLADCFYAMPDIGPNYALFRCRGMTEADRVSASLRHCGVDFRLWYGRGLHHQTYYADLPRGSLAITDSLAPQLLGLPMAPDLTDAMVARIVGCLAAG